MKQTAVEWYEKQIFNLLLKLENKEISLGEYAVKRVELFKQAKAMEKEYLELFYYQGYTQCSIEDLKPTSRDRYEDAEDYYNKIFKSE